MIQIGRNAPCPCGSGMKYKHCCLGKRSKPPLSPEARELLALVQKEMGNGGFLSVDDVNARLAKLVELANKQPRQDLAGLSPIQMDRILFHTFESPDIVTFPEHTQAEPTAPIATLFKLLVDAIGEKGLKATANGNLPRTFLREALATFDAEEQTWCDIHVSCISTEIDFFEMHVTRVVAELAGLVRKYKGRFILGSKCKHLWATGGMRVIYPLLFMTYIKKFNWGYWDGYQELSLIQHSFLFSLYLLKRYGAQWRDASFYEDCFIRAFPMVLEEVKPMLDSAEQEVRICYRIRVLERFAGFMGIAHVKEEPRGRCFLRSLPLLDEVVRFHIQGDAPSAALPEP